MAGGKETPRQKMIGMMYLVLTALLALNVSKEILDAFITINKGLEKTKTTFDIKNKQQYSALQNAYNEKKDKYAKAWQAAQVVEKSSKNIVDLINKIKAKTIGKTENLDPATLIGKNQFGSDTVWSLARVSSKDNYDINTEIMVGSEPATPKDAADADGNNYTATNLKKNLITYRDLLKTYTKSNKTLTASIDSLFSFPTVMLDATGEETNWEALNFYHVPLAATTTILSKIQTDVISAESDLISYIFADVEAATFKFTQLNALVIPSKTYVLEGDNYTADVFLSASDNTNLPTISLAGQGAKLDKKNPVLNGGTSIPIDPIDGMGKIKLPANGIGLKHWEGVIKFKGPQGEVPYHYAFEYEVAKPALVVSPTKMNVFYRGLDNPVSISVPGISLDSITPSISNGSISKAGDGSYIVKVSSGAETNISVSAKVNGKQKPMGTLPFRIKSVPDPTPMFGGKGPSDSKISKGDLTASQGVRADLKDFVFDLQYPVTSFDMTAIIGGESKTLSSSSNKVTSDMSTLAGKLRSGQRIIIENIKARAPDGTLRTLGNISLKVI
jgi:gliding motility-associated protein GldM